MAGYTISNKRKSFDLTKFMITSGFILLLSCLFVPLMAIYIYQDIFIEPDNTWFFGTPNPNYFIFAGALVWFSILIFFFLYYRNRNLMNNNKVYKLPFYLLTIPGLLVLFLSLNNYFYFDDEGIHISRFSEFNVHHYHWNDVMEATQLLEVKNGVMFEGDLVFTFKNGDNFHLAITNEVRLNKRLIYNKLRKQGIEVQREASN